MKEKKHLLPGDRVKMVTFNLSLQPPLGTGEFENYWKLIDKSGLIVNDQPVYGIHPNKVLVKFDESVSDFGLHCHNEIENSLWLLRADLERYSIKLNQMTLCNPLP